MLKEDDFRRWLVAKPQSDLTKAKPRASTKSDLAREIIAKLPSGMSNKEVHCRIVEQLNAEGIQDVPSLTTVKRIRSKKPMS
jgi:hypothetical protein